MQVEVVASGLYDWAEHDGTTAPSGASRFPDNAIPTGATRFVLYIALTGDAGTYLVEPIVRAFNEDPEFRLTIPTTPAIIREGGGAHLRWAFDVADFPKGRYEIRLCILGTEIAHLWFSLGF
jgi:hypothetical protein